MTRGIFHKIGLLVLIGSIASLTNCSGQKEPLAPVVITKPAGTILRFQGKIIKPPARFSERPFRFRFRAYICPPESLRGPAHGKRKSPACLVRFYESHTESGAPAYRHEMRVAANWTHAFVELLNTRRIAGKYSPGHNPFWFKNPGGKQTIVLKHDFDFESQENPVPDKLQIALARKFAPIIVFKAGKKYVPSNLEKYFGRFEKKKIPAKHDDIKRLRGDASPDPYLILPEGLAPGGAHLYYHVRPADTMVSGERTDALPGWRDNRNYRYRRGPGDMVVSYWIWYDVNEGPTTFGNVHQGDLESFAVLVDKNGEPKRFMTTGHDHIMLDTAWHNINSVNHHPIIFIAHGNKGADGGNPTSAYGGYQVSLDAGNVLFNFISNPIDIFPALNSKVSVIVPADLNENDLSRVRVGPGDVDPKSTRYVDIRKKILGKIEKLVKWEEPGWINEPSDRDPDGHHRTNANIAFFLRFSGQFGCHPRNRMDWASLTRFGESPLNAPFKTNLEQHFTLECPREDRCYTARIGNYCPRFKGDARTPQFIGRDNNK